MTTERTHHKKINFFSHLDAHFALLGRVNDDRGDVQGLVGLPSYGGEALDRLLIFVGFLYVFFFTSLSLEGKKTNALSFSSLL